MGRGRYINPTFGTGTRIKAYHFAKGFPTRENCDLKKPTEMFLWMLVALPGVNGAQQVMPVSYNMAVSEHMTELGAMLECPKCGYTKEPIKKYQPPASGDPHWLTNPGEWVKPDTPARTPHPAREAVNKLSSMQKAEILEILLEEQAEAEAQGSDMPHGEPD